jgi:hypothetical protein
VTTKEEVELIRLRLGRSHSWSTSEAIIAAGQLLSALDDANRRIAELETKLATVHELAENLPEEDWQDPPGCGWHGAFSKAADMLKAILDK